MTDPRARGGGEPAHDLADAWQQAVDAGTRYYQAWGRIAEDYVRDLAGAFRIPALTVRLPTVTAAPTVPASSAPRDPAPAGRPTPPPAASMVLIGPPGGSAEGAVLVENHLGHPVTAQVRAELPSGVAFEVDPQVVDLAPGESAVVRVRSALPAGPPGEWRGRLLVPELVGTAVALVLRTAGDPTPDDATVAPAEAGSGPRDAVQQ